MVQTSSLDKNTINSMLERINSVPITETLNMKILRLDKGECEAFIPRDTMWDGIFETFHGGILATIADSITCWSILTKIGSDRKVATTDFNIRFLRPCKTDVRCVAKVIKAGRTLSLAEAEIFDMEGKIVAISQVNYISLDS
ncbi:MAG: hypothetical protein CMB15_04160 [Euryarchaeota archaeon]|nr:hypothetical protein [Euryarchaeota archaeon]|tara:strand:+ start:18245 stop:18670 length:426 start_codon:yes stop_codon:yes gene_type:complete